MFVDFCLLGVLFKSCFQFQYLWMVCSYFQFLPTSVVGDCTFLRVCPFLLSCAFYWHIGPYCCCFSIVKCLTLCNPIDCSMPGSSVLHYLLEFAPIHVVPTSSLLMITLKRTKFQRCVVWTRCLVYVSDRTNFPTRKQFWTL